ncbi:hypothetical protein OQA88_6531 [Cercophora sp. LCS_1]
MARAPSPHSGQSSLQLPGAANSLNSQQGTHTTDHGANRPYLMTQWKSRDPRSSSTQSLLPSLTDQEGRRTLLIIYIHGFMGNDTSFRSFPAHVHSFLKEALTESHVIHTKIYPRYKTYKSIDVARDNFSQWLEPHESPTTDVILVGHSMGGLLAADVVLQPNVNSTYGHPFRHRILGTISMDAPLFGLHPGIVVSGIASLFRPAAAPAPVDAGQDPPAHDPSGRLSPDPSLYSELSPPSESSSPAVSPFPPPPGSQSQPAPDPYYNPPFFNDVSFIDRGWFKNIAHFANKHKEENLVKYAAYHVMSHLEFGGCLADYPGLMSRYNTLRRLEDVDEVSQPTSNRRGARVRFVNYYTASTGPLKKPKPTPVTPDTHLKPENNHRLLDGNTSDVESRTSTPRISIEDYSDGGRPTLLQELEPLPEPESPEPTPKATDENPPLEETPTPSVPTEEQETQLPPIPDLPTPPEPVNLEAYTDKEARKQAEREAKRTKKMYDQAVKNRDKAIKERQKLLDKWHRKQLKEAEKREKEQRKAAERSNSDKGKQTQRATQPEAQPHPYSSGEDSREPSVESREETPQGEKLKKKKERKFCMLPKKTNGVRDPAWIKVYMEGVDEVGAHCGLFFPGPHYEGLVGDVVTRVVEWVGEDMSRRAVAGLV